MKITDAQARLIGRLSKKYAPGAEINPVEFDGSGPSAYQNGLSRTFNNLLQKGLLTEGYLPRTYRMTTKAIQAYQRWVEKRAARLP